MAPVCVHTRTSKSRQMENTFYSNKKFRKENVCNSFGIDMRKESVILEITLPFQFIIITSKRNDQVKISTYVEDFIVKLHALDLIP